MDLLPCACALLLLAGCGASSPSRPLPDSPARAPGSSAPILSSASTPVLEVRPEAVLLNGRLLAAVPASSPSQTIEPVVRALSDLVATKGEADRVLALNVDATATATVLVSALVSAGEAQAILEVPSLRGRLLLMPTHRWQEPEPGPADLILLAGPERVTVVRLAAGNTPQEDRFDFEVIPRESASTARLGYEGVQRWASGFCAKPETPCVRALQMQLLAPMSAPEALALLDAAASSGVAGPAQRKVRVAFLPPAAPGKSASLPLPLVQRLLQHHQREFHECYNAGLQRNPKLAGRLVMRLTLDNQGIVQEVKDVSDELSSAATPGRPQVSQPLADPLVRTCVAERYKSIRFPPPPSRAVTLTWPMLFAPGPREQVSEELQ